LALAGCAGEEPIYQGQSLSRWIRQLDSKSREKHIQAVEALIVIGRDRDIVLQLHERLDHGDAEGRCGAATALLRLEPKSALPEVETRLADEDPRIRLSMATALVRANVEPGLAVPVLAELMAYDDYVLHNGAIKAFGDLDPQSSGAVPALADLLQRHATPEVRQRSAYALVRIGSNAVGAVPALTVALRDFDARVREGAATALAAIGPAASAAEGALRLALTDPDPEVRFQAGKALDSIFQGRSSERAAN
jgi:HEAT repeat protein